MGIFNTLWVSNHISKLFLPFTVSVRHKTMRPFRRVFIPPLPVKKRIRIIQKGCANRPFYHLELSYNVYEDKQPPLEVLGSYDPMPNMFNEKIIALDLERIKYHLGKGAEVSRTAAKLLGLAGVLPVHPMSYIEALRNNRKKAQKQVEEENEDLGQDSGTEV